MWLPLSSPVSIATRLSPDEVATILRARVGSELAWFSSRLAFPVVGRVSERGCVVHRNPGMSRNGFRRVLDLEFVGTESGTVLEGEFRLPYGAMLFLPFWFLAVGGSWIAAMARNLRENGLHVSQWAGNVSTPAGMLLFAALLSTAGFLWGRLSENEVLGFIDETLQEEWLRKRSTLVQSSRVTHALERDGVVILPRRYR